MDKIVLERGIVTTYDTFKGYGFIRREKGKDAFFHYQDIKSDKEPAPGDLLEFKLGKKSRGPVALEIKIIEAAQ